MHLLRSKGFTKQLKALPNSLRKQVLERLLIFSTNEFDPILNNHSLKGKHTDSRSINVNGDYRILYRRLNDETVHLHAIGTHHQLYGK